MVIPGLTSLFTVKTSWFCYSTSYNWTFLAYNPKDFPIEVKTKWNGYSYYDQNKAVLLCTYFVFLKVIM